MDKYGRIVYPRSSFCSVLVQELFALLVPTTFVLSHQISPSFICISVRCVRISQFCLKLFQLLFQGKIKQRNKFTIQCPENI